MKLHRNITLITWFNFLLDFRFYAPVAIIYFTRVSGSYALGMSVFSITMLSSALLEVPTGVFSDLIGRKQTLVAGAASTVVSVICYAVGGSYAWLVVGGVLEGLARALYSGNNDALLHDTLAETHSQSDYAHHYGRTSAMFQWALAISAAAGGILAAISFDLVMWLSVVPAVLGLAVAARVIEPNVKKQAEGNVYSQMNKAIKLFRQNYRLRMLSLSGATGYAAGESSYQFQSAFIQTVWPLWAVGIAKMLSNIGAAISFHLSGRIIKHFQALPTLLFSKLYSLILITIAYAFPTAASPLLDASTSMFHGTSTTAKSHLLQQQYSSAQRATMDSLNSLLGSLLFAIVSLCLGLFADHIGPARALLSLRLLSALSLYLLWRLFRNKD